MSQDAAQDSGLVRRGLFLLALVGGLVAVVLWIIFQRPAPAPAPATRQPEHHLGALVAIELTFPASVNWCHLGLLTDSLPSAPGWRTRYNAAASLGRLGATEVPWQVIAEMLDEEQQMRNFRERLEDGRIVTDEAAARLTMINALRAVRAWHEKQAGPVAATGELAAVHSSVRRLAAHEVVEVKKQAEDALAAIRAKSS